MEHANQAKLAANGLPHLAVRLHGWTSGEGALHVRLAASLRTAVERGDVLPGERLPTERELARALSIGRSTVAAAYASLERQGVVSRRQGSGTWVGPAAARPADRGEVAAMASHRLLAISPSDQPGETINLMTATPRGAPVLRELTGQAAAETARLSDQPGYWPLGYPPLRREIAARLTARGLRTREDEVLVTNGAQQGIALTALAFVGPGDFVLIEDPTYPGAIDAYRRTGARMLSLPVAEAGVDLDYLADVLRRAEVRLVYATPTSQNPTGAVMPPEARARLARLAAAHGVLVVDDETQAELTRRASPPPPVAAFDGEATVITLGSLSKVAWSGLRVGWVRAREPLISQLGRLKTILDLSSSLPSQVLATLLLQRWGDLLPARLEEIRSRGALLASLVSTLLPGWRFTEPSGGLVLWAKLPHGSASELAAVARGHGVRILPGPLLSASGRFDDRIRLPFVAEPEVLEEGVHLIARAWEAYASDGAARDRTVDVIV